MDLPRSHFASIEFDYTEFLIGKPSRPHSENRGLAHSAASVNRCDARTFARR